MSTRKLCQDQNRPGKAHRRLGLFSCGVPWWVGEIPLSLFGGAGLDSSARKAGVGRGGALGIGWSFPPVISRQGSAKSAEHPSQVPKKKTNKERKKSVVFVWSSGLRGPGFGHLLAKQSRWRSAPQTVISPVSRPVGEDNASIRSLTCQINGHAQKQYLQIVR